jgi:D-inositol-3-phosphate glycosyltransferase
MARPSAMTIDPPRNLAMPADIEVGLLTGGFDKPYAFGLAMSLLARGVRLDFIGSDEVDSPELRACPRLRFLKFLGSERTGAGVASKLVRVLAYYGRLICYAFVARPKVFHILWNNKFQYFDRTLLMLYYKLLGKRIAFTAHNVNAGKRDSNDSFFNRLTLRIQYRLADQIFVHSERLKAELLKDFNVCERAVSVIPFGINNSVPETDLTCGEARKRLGIREAERVLLFFGNIGPYKGLEFLVSAFQRVANNNPNYRLIIAGKLRGGANEYFGDIQQMINSDRSREQIIQRIQYIPDEETEIYFKAADVLVLPYKEVFQSGVLFLAYSFGLPVIASDVGSLREDLVVGQTGFLCRPCDPVDLARSIETFFASDLFKDLVIRRQDIRRYATIKHSWDVVGEITREVYLELLGRTHDETVGIDTHSGVQRTGMGR